MVIRIIVGVVIAALVCVTVITTPDVRTVPDPQYLIHQARQQDPHAFAGATKIQVIQIEAKDQYDRVMVWHGERLTAQYHFDHRQFKGLHGGVGRTGNQILHFWWVLALLAAVQTLLWIRQRHGWIVIAVSWWSIGATLLFASEYLRIAQWWADGGALIMIALCSWHLYRGRQSPDEELPEEIDNRQVANQSLVQEDQQNDRQEEGQSPIRHNLQQSWQLIVFLLGLGFGAYLILNSTHTVDVAWANLEGAKDILSGKSIYGSETIIYHGDTYPPLLYALYIPGQLLFPIVDALSDPTGALVVNLLVYLLTAILAYRKHATVGIAWVLSGAVLIAASAGTNDIILAGAVLLSGLGIVWAYPLAATVKLLPLAWIGAWVRRDGLRGIYWLLGFCGISLVPLLAVGGTNAIGDLYHSVAFQAERQSTNDLGVLYNWNWWHPTTKGLLVLCIVLAWWAKPKEYAWWALLIGCALFLSAQYVNVLYVSWIWALAVGVPAAILLQQKQGASIEAP